MNKISCLIVILVPICTSFCVKSLERYFARKHFDALSSYMCKSLEPRLQIGASRETIEFLKAVQLASASTAKFDFTVKENGITMNSFRASQAVDSFRYSCLVTGNDSHTVEIFFSQNKYFDKLFFITLFITALFIGLILLSLQHVALKSKLFLISNIERNILSGVTSMDGIQPSLEKHSSFLDRIFDLEVPLVKRIDEYITNQADLIQREVDLRVKSEKNAAVGRLSRHIAHDLRNPLSLIEVGIKSKNWEEFTGQLPFMKASIQKLYHMISSFSRAELENIVEPKLAWFSLYEVGNPLEKLADSYAANLSVVSELPHEIPVDTLKLERAIGNLVRNSLEAEASDIKLSGHLEFGSIVIQVSDNGPGVDRSIVSKLFEPETTFNKAGGTGLGLHYVKTIAEGHGGSVTYRKEANRSIFTISLPFHEAQTAAIQSSDDQLCQLDSLKVTNEPSLFVKIGNPGQDKVIHDSLSIAGIAVYDLETASLSAGDLLVTDDLSLMEWGLQRKAQVILVGVDEDTDKVLKKIHRKLKGKAREK